MKEGAEGTPGRAGVAALVLGTAAFAVALAVSRDGGVWWGTALAAIVSLGLVSRAEGGPRSLFRRFAPRLRDLLLGVGSGVLLVAATHGGYWLLRPSVPGMEPALASLYAMVGASARTLLTVPVLLLVVFAEEALWRGVGYDVLRRRLPAIAAVLAATVVYVLPQLVGLSPLLVVAAAGCGLVWTILREITGRPTASLVSHLVWSVIVVYLLPVGG